MRVMVTRVYPDIAPCYSVWDVEEAVRYMQHLAEFKPWFIEEPTAPE
jgi:L-alanine-DL-glutamate epimerase-like enolase superfamily enzyme